MGFQPTLKRGKKRAASPDNGEPECPTTTSKRIKCTGPLDTDDDMDDLEEPETMTTTSKVIRLTHKKAAPKKSTPKEATPKKATKEERKLARLEEMRLAEQEFDLEEDWEPLPTSKAVVKVQKEVKFVESDVPQLLRHDTRGAKKKEGPLSQNPRTVQSRTRKEERALNPVLKQIDAAAKRNQNYYSDRYQKVLKQKPEYIALLEKSKKGSAANQAKHKKLMDDMRKEYRKTLELKLIRDGTHVSCIERQLGVGENGGLYATEDDGNPAWTTLADTVLDDNDLADIAKFNEMYGEVAKGDEGIEGDEKDVVSDMNVMLHMQNRLTALQTEAQVAARKIFIKYWKQVRERLLKKLRLVQGFEWDNKFVARINHAQGCRMYVEDRNGIEILWLCSPPNLFFSPDEKKMWRCFLKCAPQHVLILKGEKKEFQDEGFFAPPGPIEWWKMKPIANNDLTPTDARVLRSDSAAGGFYYPKGPNRDFFLAWGITDGEKGRVVENLSWLDIDAKWAELRVRGS